LFTAYGNIGHSSSERGSHDDSDDDEDEEHESEEMGSQAKSRMKAIKFKL